MKRRNTAAKQSVLNILTEAKAALSQEAIEHKLTEPVDRVTIYRILNSFSEDGVVHKIVADDGKQYFALCLNCNEKGHVHNHFHFRCIKCQKVECLKEEVSVNVPAGYKLENVNCLLSGYCPNC